MILFHGTSEAVARRASVEGLRPRETTGVDSHWDIASRSDLVYLTNAYAGYFAYQAVPEAENSEEQFAIPWGFIQVDTSRLDPNKFLPDEDWLEQATRHADGPWPKWCSEEGSLSMIERTAWFRKHLEEFSHLWQRSLQELGNCAYQGEIPPEAIQSVVLFTPNTNTTMALLALAPQISLANYAISGAKYRSITRWFLGHDVTPDELDPSTAYQLEVLSSLPDGTPGIQKFTKLLRLARSRQEFLAREIKNREGLVFLLQTQE